jgi:hypothetical protein
MHPTTTRADWVVVTTGVLLIGRCAAHRWSRQVWLLVRLPHAGTPPPDLDDVSARTRVAIRVTAPSTASATLGRPRPPPSEVSGGREFLV